MTMISPITYMGSKRRLLKQLLPLFPDKINAFYDLFAGSLTVSLNVQANSYVANDLNQPLISLFSFMIHADEKELELIKQNLKAGQDKEKFYWLREAYNHRNLSIIDENLALLSLTVSAFTSCAFRFNQKGKYNSPWSNKDHLTDFYYHNKYKKIVDMVNYFKNKEIKLTSKSYEAYINQDFKPNDFVYLDPPYFGTDASYKGWGEREEIKLYQNLEILNNKGVKFALSNVLTHGDKLNPYLDDFIKNNDVQVYHLNMNYSNSTYHTKRRKSDEILVTNYIK